MNMRTKSKSDLRTENAKMTAMLKALGMDESFDKMLDADIEAITTAGQTWNKAFAEGQNAINILSDLKRDHHNDWVEMAVPTTEELEMVETVEQFQDRVPSFCIAEVILDFNLDVPYQPRRVFKQGQQICLVPIMYKQYNQLKPCLKPGNVKFRDIYKPYRGEDLTGKTLFAWRAGGIGDLLFIRPILMHLKEKYGCRIILSTKAQYHDMVGNWDDALDAIADIDFDINTTLLASDYHMTFEGLIERCDEANEIDVHDLFAKYAGLDPDEVEWCRPMTMPETEHEFFTRDNGKYVAVQVRSSAAVRTPFVGTYKRLIDACTARGFKVVISEASHNDRPVNELISVCERQDMIEWFKGSLAEVIRLVSGAAFVIAPDSALTHMAAMQDVPCLSLYGAFPSKVRTQRYAKCIALDTPPDESLPCGGNSCFLHATHGTCPNGFKCWSNFENDVAVDCVNALANAWEADHA